MRVGVYTDLRFTGSKAPTGVGKHIARMVGGIAATQDWQVSVLGTRDQLDNEGRVPVDSELAGLPARQLPLGWKVADAIWTAFGQPSADRWCVGLDWVYCPKNDFIPVKGPRLAITVHGAAELDPGMPGPGGMKAGLNRVRRRIAYKRIVGRADAILTVSNFLKQQILDWFGANPERVHVVGNGVEQEFFLANRLALGASGEMSRGPFVLAVGGLNHLDGGDRLLATARLLRRQSADLRILVAGGLHLPEWREEAERMGNITLLGYVRSHRLAEYMRDAVALLFPTRYETFGIAVAESMAVGTPVVTCRSTAIPEIAGDAALYVDPEEPEAIVQAIGSLSRDRELREQIVERGLSRARRFTWPACVERLRAVLMSQ